MLTLKECDEKLEEIAYLKSIQNEDSSMGREHIAHLTRLERAYQKERINAMIRIANKEDSVLNPSRGFYE